MGDTEVMETGAILVVVGGLVVFDGLEHATNNKAIVVTRHRLRSFGLIILQKSTLRYK